MVWLFTQEIFYAFSLLFLWIMTKKFYTYLVVFISTNMKPIPIDIIAAFIVAKEATANDKIELNLINKENISTAEMIISSKNNKTLSNTKVIEKNCFLQH